MKGVWLGDTSDMVRRLVLLKENIERYEENLKSLKAESLGLEQEILERFINEGVQGMRVDEYNASPRSDTYPRPRNGQPALCAALKQTGLGDLVKEQVNLSTLRSHVLEQQKMGQPLPDALAAQIELSVVHRVSLTKRKS